MDPDPDPQKQPVYPQQYPPQYPQQYPPQYYGPPHYPPYPPPKKNHKTTLIIVIAVIVVFVVVPMIISAVLYSFVSNFEPPGFPGSQVPTGTWGAKTVLSNTAVNVDFGKINPEPIPMDIEIILIRNGTAQGTYIFADNNDGSLYFAAGSGTDVCDMEYSDLADNQRVNIGDQLKLTHLRPRSDYRIRMIWGPTGDQITSTTFSTP
jgi:hypothetical protein